MNNVLVHNRLNSLLITLAISLCLFLFLNNGFAQALPKSSPESVGLSTQRLLRVDALFEDYIANGLMAGAVVAIARDGRLAHFEALGGVDMDHSRPMTTDAIFRMASMTRDLTVAHL